jgi:hypothetical protein
MAAHGPLAAAHRTSDAPFHSGVTFGGNLDRPAMRALLGEPPLQAQGEDKWFILLLLEPLRPEPSERHVSH